MIGLIENPEFDGSAYTMTHLGFHVSESEFPQWVEKINDAGLTVVAGPKEQRGGETILFRTPRGIIIETCYPHARTCGREVQAARFRRQFIGNPS